MLTGNIPLSVFALLFLLVAATVPTAHADHIIDENLYVYLPKSMLAGETYHGMVVLDTPAPFFGGGEKVGIATASTNMMIPNSVTVPAGGNHGVFEVQTLRDGFVEIYATYGGKTGYADGFVYSVSSEPRTLELVMAATDVAANRVGGIVLLSDGSGRPVAAPQDMEIDLVASGLNNTPDTIVIEAGKTHALFVADIAGSGNITAVTPISHTVSGAAVGLAEDSEFVLYGTDNVRVQMAVAPHNVVAGGDMRYVVWLERNVGGVWAPYNPEKSISVELQTTDMNVVRLTENYASDTQGSIIIRMENGTARGTLYAGTDDDRDGMVGFATVAATIPEYGTTTADVCVGTYTQQSTSDGHQNEKCEIIDDELFDMYLFDLFEGAVDTLDVLGTLDNRTGVLTDVFWAGEGRDTEIQEFPYVTLELLPPVISAGATEAVVGFYGTTGMELTGIYEQEITETDTNTNTETTTIQKYSKNVAVENVTPLRVIQKHVAASASSDDIIMQEAHTVSPIRYTNAYSFPVAAHAEDVYTIGVTSEGSIAEAELYVVPPYETTYQVRVVPLPVPAQTEGLHPLFLVSITDSSGRLIDIADEFGRDRVVRMYVGGSDEHTDVTVSMESNTGVHYGTMITDTNREVLAVLQTDGGSLPAATGAESEIFLVGAPTQVDLDIPLHIHAGEPLPVAAHATDQNDVPVSRITSQQQDNISVGGFEWLQEGLVQVSGTATGETEFTLLDPESGVAQKDTTTFLNNVTMDATAPSNTNRDKSFKIQSVVRTADGSIVGDAATYRIDTTWPHEYLGGGTFEVTPDTEGTQTITITANIAGYYPEESQVTVEAVKPPLQAAVMVDAYDTNGEILPTQFTWQQNNENSTEYNTPYAAEFIETSTIHVVFPAEQGLLYSLHDVELEGARIDPELERNEHRITIDEGTRDVYVTAVYEKRIRIDVNNGAGGGIYPHGQDVFVIADPKEPLVPILLPYKVVSWDGAPAEFTESIVITAERDTTLEPKYELDFSRLVYVAMAGATAAVLVVYKVYGNRFRYMFQDVIEGLRPS